jgi:putative hydrolase of the HAD superfamily
MNYKNYIFDLYGTLVDIHTNENKNYLWKKTADFLKCYGIDYKPNELKKRYFQLVQELEAEISEIQLERVFEKLVEKENEQKDAEFIRALSQMFRVLSRDYLRLYPNVISMLEELKKNGKKVYLLSNAQRIFTVPEMEQLGLIPYFDGIYISSDLGCKKPQVDFMTKLIAEYDLDIKESVMIGNDETTDIARAIKCNMDSIYIHSNLSPDYTEAFKATNEIWNGDVMKILAF